MKTLLGRVSTIAMSSALCLTGLTPVAFADEVAGVEDYPQSLISTQTDLSDEGEDSSVLSTSDAPDGTGDPVVDPTTDPSSEPSAVADEDALDLDLAQSPDTSLKRSSKSIDGEGIGLLSAGPSGTWGNAPWSFDVATGVLTIEGSGDEDDPYTLGDWTTSPWNRTGTEKVGASAIKTIILENPESIKLPVASERLFSSNASTSWLSNLTEIPGIGQVNTSAVTDMSDMFSHASSLKSLDLSDWNTSSLVNMNSMFSNAYVLESLDLSGWITGSVTGMNGVFFDARSLKDLNLSGWVTGSVTDMGFMFRGASSLTSLDLSTWNTSGLPNMGYMFWNASSLASLKAGANTKLLGEVGLPSLTANSTFTGKWVRVGDSSGTSAWWSGTGAQLAMLTQSAGGAAGTYVWQQKAPVTVDLGTGTWPEQPSSLASAAVGSLVALPASVPTSPTGLFMSWTLTNGTDSRELTADASFVVSVPGMTLTANYDELKWGEAPWVFDSVSGVLTIYGSGDEGDPNTLGNYEASPWNRTDGEKVTASLIKKIVLEHPESIKFPEDSQYLFSYSREGYLSEVTEIVGIGEVITEGVTNMYAMFLVMSSLEEVDLSGWDTSSVLNMAGMFAYASSLEELDLSNWDTSSVGHMSDMFAGASALEELNVSGWDTSSVSDMSSMFYGVSSLESFDLSGLDTSSVSDMSYMFAGASALEELDLSGWDTSSVLDMRYMFFGAPSLAELDLSGWDTSCVSVMLGMFSGTTSLASLTLGEKTKLAGDLFLPTPWPSETLTGSWVRVGLSSDTSAWWSGTGGELIERSQNPVTAAGTYVWQLKAPVTVDLGAGTWASDAQPTNLAGLQDAEIGDFVAVPDADPVWKDHDFVGWQLSRLTVERAPAALTSFVVSERDLTLTAQWDDTVYRVTFDLAGGDPSSEFDAVEGIVGKDVALPSQIPTRAGYRFATWEDQAGGVFGAGDSFWMPSGGVALTAKWQSAWGEAPWSFDVDSGVLTIYGSGDPDDPYELGATGSSPWLRNDDSQIPAHQVRKIVLAQPSSIRLPQNSGYLFGDGTVGQTGGLPNLTEIEGASDVQTDQLLDVSGMFEGASSLESLDLSNWELSDQVYMADMFARTSSLRSLTLGEGISLTDDLGLEAPVGEGYTGLWVRLGSAADTSPWWRGTSADLSELGDGAAGTYVWQLKAPVEFDLSDGAWPAQGPTNLDALSNAAVGDLVYMPNVDPTYEGYKFLGWQRGLVRSLDGLLQKGDSFVVTNQEILLQSMWEKAPDPKPTPPGGGGEKPGSDTSTQGLATDSLPNTGASTALFGMFGSALALAGALMLGASQRRRREG